MSTYGDEPTPRQVEVLRYLARHQAQRGYGSTMRQMCEAFGWSSTHAAFDYVRALKRKGLVTSAPLTARSIVLTPRALKWVTQ